MVALCLFLAGLSGALALIGFAALLGDAPRELVLSALWLSSGSGAIAAAVLLPRGRLSLGVGLVAVHACLVVAATVACSFTSAPPLLVEGEGGPVHTLLWLVLAPGALLGAALATYAGALVGVRALPSERRQLLPLHAAALSVGSAAAILELLSPLPPLWALGALAALVETFLLIALADARHDGRRLFLVGGLLAGPTSLALRLVGLTPVASVAFVAGALVSRFGWQLQGLSAATPRARASTP